MAVADTQTLKLYRWVILAGGVSISWSYTELGPAYQALQPYLSWALGAYGLHFCFGLRATFSRSRLAPYVGWISVSAGYCLASYFLLRMIASNAGNDDPLSSLLLIALLVTILHEPKLVWAWCVGSCLILLQCVWFVDNPQFTDASIVSNFLICAAIAGVFKVSLIRRREREEVANALIRSVFESSVDGMYYIENDTDKLLGMNKKMLELFETDDQTLVRKMCKAVLLAQGGGIKTHQQLDGEFETSSGRKFYGQISVSPVPVVKSARHATLIRLIDLTALHKQQQQLELAKEKAVVAMEARGLFLANMSHEIRTPMNGVIGMTSLLINTPLDDEQHSFVETIRSSGESLLVIINEILDFSKLEAGQVELELQAFDLEQCAAEALDIISPIASAKNLELVFDCQLLAPTSVIGDIQRLRQVLVNLLSNAVKFTEQGEVCLRLRVHSQSARPGASAQVMIEVIDSGIGIPQDKVGKLFDAFTQADASTTRRFGGTGLGLSISRSLVELMGGELEARSVFGKGSTFCFQIPLQLGVAPKVVPRSKLAKQVIYAVDDNATNRQVLAGQLAELGATAKLFDTPHALLAACKSGNPDLIIADMAMPDMDGLSMTQQLPVANRPPVILLTSLDSQDVAREHFSAIARKPVRPSELQRCLDTALQLGSKSHLASSPAYMEPLKFESQFVLLAEDNQTNQIVAKQMLKKLGLGCDVASNGREAIEMLCKRPYSIVLMDVQMPELDGLEATRLIRADSQLDQPYILAMTANARAEDRASCLEAGMDDFVSKPVRLQDLRNALERAQSTAQTV